VLEERVET